MQKLQVKSPLSATGAPRNMKYQFLRREKASKLQLGNCGTTSLESSLPKNSIRSYSKVPSLSKLSNPQASPTFLSALKAKTGSSSFVHSQVSIFLLCPLSTQSISLHLQPTVSDWPQFKLVWYLKILTKLIRFKTANFNSSSLNPGWIV